jgi:hypothetical protein
MVHYLSQELYHLDAGAWFTARLPLRPQVEAPRQPSCSTWRRRAVGVLALVRSQPVRSLLVGALRTSMEGDVRRT